MILDKALLIKGVAGVAAVGGIATTGVALKKGTTLNKLFFSSSNANEAREEEKGIPSDCGGSKTCSLSEETIKKIKFKNLESGEGDVTVSTSTVNVTLTIKGDKETKRYIFENKGSEQITLSRGTAKVNLPQGKSRFVAEDNKFKLMEMGDYGIPKRCSSTCDLLDDDLGLINFSDLTGTGEVTVTGLAEGKKVSLTKENDTYIFKSPSSVNITKGGTTVNLSAGETDFKVDQGKLKKVDLWTFGLPKDCEYKDGDTSKTCTLSSRDLKKIKFKDMGTNILISGLNNNEKVTLEIKKVEDSSYPGGRKYTFTSGGTGDVTITSSPDKSITISKEDETAFKKENTSSEVLVALPKRKKPTEEVKGLDSKINNLGLPSSCTFTEKAEGDKKSIECELSKEELKKVKFSDKYGNDVTVTEVDGDDINYRIRIEEVTGENQFSTKNIKVTFLNRDIPWSKKLTLTVTNGSGGSLIIYKNSDTEFKIKGENRLQKAWKVSDLSALIGLSCGEENQATTVKCALKSESETIKVYLEGGTKEFKPSNTSSSDLGICFDEEQDDFFQEIMLKVSSAIEGTVDDAPKNLETGEYEIRRFEGNNWALVKQSSSPGH